MEYSPASLIKKRTIRPKYAKKEGEGVLIAQLPSRPLEKSIAEASLLAHILVSKFVDHLPFYRQIQRFHRDFGWEPASSTLSDWMSGCCELLEPLYNALKQKILASGYIQADESPIKVLDSDKKGSTHQGYQWVYHDPTGKLVLFDTERVVGSMALKNFFRAIRAICNVMAIRSMIKSEQIRPLPRQDVWCMRVEYLTTHWIMTRHDQKRR